MKLNSSVLLLAGLGIGAYLLLKPKTAAASMAATDVSPLGQLGNILPDLQAAANLATQGAQQIFNPSGLLQNAQQAYTAGVGKVFGALNPTALGNTPPATTQAFSNAFNTFVGGGVQQVQPNAAGTAININPNIPQASAAYQTVNANLASAALNAGIGVGSLAPWAGGGVATSFSALASPSTSISGVKGTSPTVNIASLLATGRIG